VNVLAVETWVDGVVGGGDANKMRIERMAMASPLLTGIA
jgi:hypothetical protein